jgi:hypothetical protein
MLSASHGRSVQSWGLATTLAFFCGALTSACDTSVGSRLSGRWLGVEIESLDGSVSAGRAGWAKGTSLTFSGSSLTVAQPGEEPRRGAYKVVSEDDGQLELAIAGHDGHIDHTQLTLETDRLLRWHLTSVHTLVMQRE